MTTTTFHYENRSSHPLTYRHPPQQTQTNRRRCKLTRMMIESSNNGRRKSVIRVRTHTYTHQRLVKTSSENASEWQPVKRGDNSLLLLALQRKRAAHTKIGGGGGGMTINMCVNVCGDRMVHMGGLSLTSLVTQSTQKL